MHSNPRVILLSIDCSPLGASSPLLAGILSGLQCANRFDNAVLVLENLQRQTAAGMPSDVAM